MFGKKKKVQLDLKIEGGYHRLIVDYFDAKDKDLVRETLYAYLMEAYGDVLLQVDSNFINKKMDGKEGDWMESLIQWAGDLGMETESFMFNREVSTSMLGSIMGSKVTKPGYRVGVVMKAEHAAEAVKRHNEIGMGVHLGCGILNENRENLMKDYCGGRINEFNFEKYYAVDVYDYDLISRCVMRCLTAEPLENAKKYFADKLLK